MKNLKKSSLVLLVVLLVAGVLALTSCSATPLPPLFLAGGSGAAQPAAPAALAPASEPIAVEASAIAASEAVTTSETVEVAQPAAAAPGASVTVTETSALNAAGVITASVRAADVVTTTAPIASAVVITSVQAVDAVAASAAQPASTATATRVAPTATRVAPTPTRRAPTATRVVPTATRAPARPTATPTPQWPKSLVITADDLEKGATSVPGLQVTGLDVQFGDDAMTMSFDSLRYSFVSMRDVTIDGHFVVNNCDVDFVADRITPRNLATGAIPGFINQSLDQQLGAWCVESLTVQPGQLVATVRPR
jgi:hypothetical protein